MSDAALAVLSVFLATAARADIPPPHQTDWLVYGYPNVVTALFLLALLGVVVGLPASGVVVYRWRRSGKRPGWKGLTLIAWSAASLASPILLSLAAANRILLGWLIVLAIVAASVHQSRRSGRSGAEKP